MVVFPVSRWPECDDEKVIVCVCATRADAEEMVLSLEENSAYDGYLEMLQYDDCLTNFLNMPFDSREYFNEGPVEFM